MPRTRISFTFRQRRFQHSTDAPSVAAQLREGARFLRLHPCIRSEAFDTSEVAFLWHALWLQATASDAAPLCLLRRSYRGHDYHWSIPQRLFFYAALLMAELFALVPVRNTTLTWPEFRALAQDFEARRLQPTLWYRNAPFLLPVNFLWDSPAAELHLIPLVTSNAWRQEFWSLPDFQAGCRCMSQCS